VEGRGVTQAQRVRKYRLKCSDDWIFHRSMFGFCK
jgi:hypothetical protein